METSDGIEPSVNAREALGSPREEEHVGFKVFTRALDLYFGGDMEVSIALGGQWVDRLGAIKPVAQTMVETMAGFRTTIEQLAGITGCSP